MKKVNFLCLIMLGLFFVACHSNARYVGRLDPLGLFV